MKIKKVLVNEDRTKTMLLNKIAAALVIVLVGTIVTAKASAECLSLPGHRAGASLSPQSWRGAGSGSASLLRASDQSSNDPIVGFWKVVFTAGDTTIDSALVQWHSDGTEIMNSGRPAQDGNFCLGVWQKTGGSKYKLNHFALGNDTTNAPTGIGNPSGPTHIIENIILSQDGNRYAGTFTLFAHDASNKLVVRIAGIITATRITVDTPESSVF
jgi:hypothetical protein